VGFKGTPNDRRSRLPHFTIQRVIAEIKPDFSLEIDFEGAEKLEVLDPTDPSLRITVFGRIQQ
jgi:hypothetical protein